MSERDYGTLRQIQADALALIRDIVAGDPRFDGRKAFTLYGTPGVGKTRAARVFAHEAIALGIVKRVVVVVPNENLRTQFRNGFCDPGAGCPYSLMLRTNDSLRRHRTQVSIPGLPRGKDRGYVATYQQIAADPRLHAELVAGNKTLLALDEVHHLSEHERTTWRDALAPMVEAAEMTLSMTGTLDRTDKERIPWVGVSDDGQTYLTDVSCGRRVALAEGSILPVSFRMIDGATVFPYQHEERATLLSTARAKEAGKALTTALNDPAYAHAMALNALREWKHYRDTKNPQAKALVICHSTSAADALKSVVEREIGARVVVVHSNLSDSNAAELIDAFRDGVGDVLITVAMASEGFDCPAISHTVYLTNVVAPVAVQQSWARNLRPNHRSELPVEKQLAYTYVPMHPVLVGYVENWMEEQIGFFREYERAAGKPRRRGGRGASEPGRGTIGEEYAGDQEGKLADDEQAIWNRAIAFDSTLRHRAPRDVVAYVRGMAAVAGQ